MHVDWWPPASVYEGNHVIQQAGHKPIMHAWHTDFCKPLIADSYCHPSVFCCSKLQFSDLTHHQHPGCPLMKQDLWTVAMENPPGNVCLRMVAVETSQWVSTTTHLMQCHVLTIKVDTWNETRSALQCTCLSPVIIIGIDRTHPPSILSVIHQRCTSVTHFWVPMRWSSSWN